ncbi:hypothetical protein JN535_04210 [Cellulosimicrobium cellulans]|uniref:VG15 protein n=1 Tax=Cellulosimicrobium cellulans TaxID=1710 RepID=UPI00196456C3|nr:hypothetical protein [Cellulosimicrobium cellulans]MBN0039378.1 hypothetical protein [Cellulosimicrobium cellulans]
MVTQAKAAELRHAQAGLLTLLSRDLAAFFASLDLDKPERARDALLEYLPLLVAQYGEAGAAAAADWFDEVRAEERVPGRFRAEAAEPVEPEIVEASVRYSAGHLFTAAPGLALPSLQSAASKQVLLPARQTIVRATGRDPRASGWGRLTRSGACDFCRFLAQRGAVYKEATAHFASHGDCNCAAVPSWDQDAPEVDVDAYVASQRMESVRRRAAAGDAAAARQLEEHTARVRDYIDAFIAVDD